MNYKALFQRILRLLSAPGKEWQDILTEDKRTVMPAFVYPLIGFCGLAVFLGTLMEGSGGASGYLVFQRAMTTCCAQCVSLFGGYFLAAYGLNQLATRFFSQPDNQPLMQQLAGYALVVTFVLHFATALLPEFALLSWIFQFYTIYIVWEGVQALLHLDEKQQMPFTLAASLLLLACPAFIGWIFNHMTTLLN
ncbi:MAG: Yip1 family protein [Bacteroidaceae bacterium]